MGRATASVHLGGPPGLAGNIGKAHRAWTDKAFRTAGTQLTSMDVRISSIGHCWYLYGVRIYMKSPKD